MQPAPDILQADARVRALSGPAFLATVLLGAGVTLLLVAVFVIGAFLTTTDTGVRALQVDFRIFWAAARLAVSGEPLAAFDIGRLQAEHGISLGEYMPWVYPPGYLALMLPFGVLSFAQAYLVATLASLVAIAAATRPYVARAVPVWIAVILAPAYLPALILGQNSLLWLAGLLAALVALRAGRWVMAGVFIGLLTLKPQLGLMIPFALLAAGLWRTILVASGTALLLAALPTLAFGIGYWPLFAHALSAHGTWLLQEISTLPLSVGPFYLLSLLGLQPGTLVALQAALAVIMAGSVYLFWRSERVDFDLKAATLLIAIQLSAAYLWYYEAAMLPMIGIFLVRAGVLTGRPWHVLLLGLLWIGAGLQSVNAFIEFADRRYLGAVIVTPLLAICFLLAWRNFAFGSRAGPADP